LRFSLEEEREMTNSNGILGVVAGAGVIVLACAGFAFLQTSRKAELESSARDLKARVITLEKELEETKSKYTELYQEKAEAANRIRQLQKKVEQQQAQLAPVQPGDSAGAQGRTRAAGKARSGKDRSGLDFSKILEAADSPEFREMMLEGMKTAMESMYGPFAQTMNFSPEKRQQFMDLMLKHMEQGQKAGFDALKGETDGLINLQKQNEAELKAFLGDEGYRKYESYSQTIGVRMVVDAARTQLAYTSHPLQDHQLMQIIDDEVAKSQTAKTSVKDPSDPSKMMGELVGEQQKLYQAIVNRSASFLSPDQLKVLASSFDAQVSIMDLGGVLMEKLDAKNTETKAIQ
jgi:outer membrane murein-binding lipoprotein Lpp